MAYKHGMSDTPEYQAWTHMRSRCSNPNHAAWENYGGRGVSVCEEWDTTDGGFEAFYEHVGPRPSEVHEIDRIDNDGDYESGNVRWVHQAENQRNKRSNVLLKHDGRTMTAAEWAREVGISPALLSYRLNAGWGVADALTIEPGKGNAAFAKERSRNRSSNRLISVDGEERVLAEWSEVSGVDADTIRKRLERGWPPKRAIFEEPSRGSLDDGDVVQIRRRACSGEKYAAIAEDFGISKSMVSMIKTGRAYADVDGREGAMVRVSEVGQ